MTDLTQASDACPWLVGERIPGETRVDLVCFAHAGGGPSVFTSWRHALPGHVRVLAVQLPGRERRMSEAPLCDARVAAARIGAAIVRFLARGGKARRLVLFGHSLGALLAYETAAWLERQGEAPPDVLIAAGRRAPDLPLGRPLFHALGEAEFITQVRAMGGTPAGVLEDPRLSRLVLPLLRADIAMNDAYEPRPAPRLTARITALRGLNDPFARADEVARWATFAEVGAFRCITIPGGHFFVRERAEEVLDIIRAETQPT